MSILVGISAVAIIYCILNGTAILNAFTPEVSYCWCDCLFRCIRICEYVRYEVFFVTA